MPHHLFTPDDLMDLLVEAVGLPEQSRTAGPETLLTDLGLDSLAFLELQGQLADRYGIVLADDAERTCTVGDVVALVQGADSQAVA